MAPNSGGGAGQATVAKFRVPRKICTSRRGTEVFLVSKVDSSRRIWISLTFSSGGLRDSPFAFTFIPQQICSGANSPSSSRFSALMARGPKMRRAPSSAKLPAIQARRPRSGSTRTSSSIERCE